MTISIAGRSIGEGCPPYVVAEMSANHNSDLNRAYRIIDAAKEAGADAVKLQSYSADTLTIDHRGPDFDINEGLWKGQNLHDLYKASSMPWEWHEPLVAYGKKLGLSVFSSPFDNSAVDLLSKLDVPAYKIASFELVDHPLIRYVAKQNRPMIMSTGMANQEEIADAVEVARSAGCGDLILLHCVSGYPAPTEDYNLATMVDMRSRYGVLTGLSDHTIDNTTAIAAVALGACFIEKHVTLNRDGGGADDSFSLEPEELKSLVTQARTAWGAIGKINYGLKSSETENVKFRRSLYIVEDIEQGEAFTEKNVRSIRPGFGMKPKHFDAVIGNQSTQPLSRGTALKAEHVSGLTLTDDE